MNAFLSVWDGSTGTPDGARPSAGAVTIRACSRVVRALLALAMAGVATAPVQAQDAVFDRVAERARQLAAEPHRAPQRSWRR
jgi:hypothetical protein